MCGSAARLPAHLPARRCKRAPCPVATHPTHPARRSVDEGAHLDPTDQRVFLVNCLFTLAAPLAGRECALAQAQQLQ